ncbi:MAG: ribose 5-phosphate isomerase A [Anaerolineales bacterium]
MNLKQQAALQALTYVHNGMVLGLGTGSTTKYFIELLGEKLRSGELERITGVPTSEGTRKLANNQKIPLVSFSSLSPGRAVPSLDLVVDGADEIDPKLNLVKGLGRALLREKIIETHARVFLVIADESKLVSRLGEGPLPVEIVQYEFGAQVRWLRSLGCRAELWLEQNGEPIITDNGNYLVRCWFADGIPDAYQLARLLADRPGIVEHGLFLDMADIAIIAGEDGTQIKERK